VPPPQLSCSRCESARSPGISRYVGFGAVGAEREARVEATPGEVTSESVIRRIAPDRRAYRRAPLDRPVLVETSSKTITARGFDVSGGGISLRTDLAMTVGERVSMYFELPIGFCVEVHGEVLRQEGTFVALRFVDPAYQTVLAIRGFCRISGLTPAAP